MEDTLDLKKLVNGYLWQINDVDKALTKLATDVQGLAREVEEHEEARAAAQANLARLRSNQEALREQRESLFRAHSEASFVQDTAELQRISRKRVELDKKAEEVAESISNCVVPSEDFSQSAATLKMRHDELKQRLPSHSMLPMHVETLTPFLKSIYDAMKADSRRLYDKHKAIKVPALYTSKQLENLRLMDGRATNKDPAYLRRQEEFRRERERKLRIKRQNEGERIRRGGGPVHTGQEVREQEGSSLADMTLREATKV